MKNYESYLSLSTTISIMTSKGVTQGLSFHEKYDNYFGLIIQNCVTLFNLHRNIQISNVKQYENKVAHA